MPFTELDAKCALVVIDIQKGITAYPGVPHCASDVTGKCAALAEKFRSVGRPVVLVNVGFHPDCGNVIRTKCDMSLGGAPTSPDFMVLCDELKADPQLDVFVTKHNWGAFHGTDLDDQLRRRGITQIVLCGIRSSVGVESTARQAHERNYNIVFAEDATTDGEIECHERAFKSIFPKIGQVTTTEAILKIL